MLSKSLDRCPSSSSLSTQPYIDLTGPRGFQNASLTLCLGQQPLRHCWLTSNNNKNSPLRGSLLQPQLMSPHPGKQPHPTTLWPNHRLSQLSQTSLESPDTTPVFHRGNRQIQTHTRVSPLPAILQLHLTCLLKSHPNHRQTAPGSQKRVGALG